MIKRILFFRTGSIGDVLMSTPLVRQIRQNFPDSRIDYLVGKWSAPALKGNKYIDEVISFNDDIITKKKIFPLINLIKKIRKRNYDLIFMLNKHRLFNFTGFLFGIKRRIGFDRLGEGIFLTNKVDFDSVRHEIFYYLDLAMAAGIKADYKDTSMDLFLNRKDEKFAGGIFGKYNLNNKHIIGISPGGCYNPQSGYDTARQWPIERYAELAERLAKRGIFILLFGGKNDAYLNEHFSRNARIINLIGKTTISQAAALIKRCDYFICNDCGLMHIAACVNKRIISIFGPTNPRRKAPLLKDSISIWKDMNIYNSKAELIGEKQADIFMKNVRVEDILRRTKI